MWNKSDVRETTGSIRFEKLLYLEETPWEMEFQLQKRELKF